MNEITQLLHIDPLLLQALREDIPEASDISKVLMNIQKVQNQAKYFNTSKNIDLHDVLKTSDERKINDNLLFN